MKKNIRDWFVVIAWIAYIILLIRAYEQLPSI